MNLKYTICFCRHRGKVLMIYRTFPPNERLWNGLGGKLEAGESARDSIYREMKEEAGLALQGAHLRYCGIVSWSYPTGSPEIGMYAFVADLPDRSFDTSAMEGRKTVEGLLSWKQESWVTDRKNSELVCNIPYFLPHMLREDPPQDYFFTFIGNTVDTFDIRKLYVMI